MKKKGDNALSDMLPLVLSASLPLEFVRRFFLEITPRLRKILDIYLNFPSWVERQLRIQLIFFCSSYAGSKSKNNCMTP
jgi:hypothetical protein